MYVMRIVVVVCDEAECKAEIDRKATVLTVLFPGEVISGRSINNVAQSLIDVVPVES